MVLGSTIYHYHPNMLSALSLIVFVLCSRNDLARFFQKNSNEFILLYLVYCLVFLVDVHRVWLYL